MDHRPRQRAAAGAQFGDERIRTARVGTHGRAPVGVSGSAHIDVVAGVDRNPIAVVVCGGAEEGVPGERTGAGKLGHEDIHATAIGPHRRAPGGIGLTCHVDIAAGVDTHRVGLIRAAGTAQEGVPEEVAAAVQLGHIRIVAGAEGTHGRTPCGAAIPHHIDIPAAIHSDRLAEVEIGRAHV